MMNTAKKVFFLLALTAIVVGGVFAQTLTGLWRSPSSNVFSFYDNKAVFTEINNIGWKEVEKKGNIGIGSLATRNIRSTGNLTWSGQDLTYNTSTYAVRWGDNITMTLNPNMQTFELAYPNGQKATYTRVQ
jgi:hypothetical protein